MITSRVIGCWCLVNHCDKVQCGQVVLTITNKSSIHVITVQLMQKLTKHHRNNTTHKNQHTEHRTQNTTRRTPYAYCEGACERLNGRASMLTCKRATGRTARPVIKRMMDARAGCVGTGNIGWLVRIRKSGGRFRGRAHGCSPTMAAKTSRTK